MRYGVTTVPRVRKQLPSETNAAEIFQAIETTALVDAIANVLRQGGAVMLGQTRDNAKLITTVYLDGDQDKEYCEDAAEALKFFAEYRV